MGLSQGMKPLGGVAVVADHTWAAHAGAQGAEGRVEPGRRGRLRLGRVPEGAGRPRRRSRPRSCSNRGDVDAALGARRQAASRRSTTRRTSSTARSSRRPRSPRCRTGAARSGPAPRTRWAPARRWPRRLGLPVEKVTLHVTLLGGGFGRKSKPDFIVEAALLSQKVGRPVKVTWTREDEIQHGFYHSVSAQHLEAGLDAAGRTVAWRHRTVFPSIALHLRREGRVPAELGAGHGLHRRALRRAQPAPRERPDRPRRAHRVAAVGGEHLPRLRRSAPSRTSWPTPRAPIPGTTS